MKANKTFSLILGLGLAWSLVACEGQNPFKRESNPVKDYPNAMSANEPVNKPRTPADPPPNNNQGACIDHFKLSVQGDHGWKWLKFVEETEASYLINVRNMMGGGFDVQTSALRNGSFTLVKRDKNFNTYKLTWRPAKGEADQPLMLNYVSPNMERYCTGSAQDKLNLDVDSTLTNPIVSIEGLKNKLVFGKSATFTIFINDPASTKDAAPQLLEPSFNRDLYSGETEVVDASKAIHCANHGTHVEGTRWKIECSFDSNSLSQAIVSKYKDSGKVVDASFLLTAVSTRGRNNYSPQVSFTVAVEFPNLETAVKGTDEELELIEESQNEIPIPTWRPDPNGGE